VQPGDDGTPKFPPPKWGAQKMPCPKGEVINNSVICDGAGFSVPPGMIHSPHDDKSSISIRCGGTIISLVIVDLPSNNNLNFE
jgi:hypothetical protein